ncbi:PHD-finger domain-containing protein [Sarocladium implicatum]|nr:PHD-finger domain-containing protein [Sarocladium implicatum]
MSDTLMSEPNKAVRQPSSQATNGIEDIKQNGLSQSHSGPRMSETRDLDVPPATSKYIYTPQFSSVSQAMILNRITSRSSSGTQDVDTRKALLNSFHNTTLPLPETSSSPYDLASLRASATHRRLSLKRKRPNANLSTPTASPDDASASDFAKLTTLPLPTPQHATYPQHYHPSSASFKPATPPATCSKCHLSGAPGNILVSCAKCPICIHQQCSIPAVDDFRARDGSFICRDCLLSGDADGEEGKKKRRRQLAAAQEEDLERMRRRRLDMLPEGVIPAKASLVGFKGGDASTAARSQYFSELHPTDLLNIISFCDQLKPQLLVDLLVSISKRHPDLPIFDSPDWSSHLPPLPPTHQRPRVGVAKPQINRARHNQAKTKQRSSKAGGGTKKVSKALPAARTREVLVETTQAEEEEEEDDAYVLPPTWRKAGQGMYSMLPLETDDRKFLLDTNDEESFSHFMVDKSGHQIIDPV